MDFSNEHCGEAWAHNKHEWLPGYGYYAGAQWKVCPGSDEQGKRPIPSVRSIELKASKEDA